jgi:hypothetical protein
LRRQTITTEADVDIEKKLEDAIATGIVEGVKSVLVRQYDNPLTKVFAAVLESHSGKFRLMIEKAVAECATNPEFVESIKSATRTALAKTLVQRIGGDIEKQVNALKSDPLMRARITLALEEIVKERSPAG